jgi:predicted nucleic acid-binding protein
MEKSNHSRRETAVKIVIDTYAWIEFFIGSEKGCRVKELLENADEIYTPGIVLAEIARKYIREGADEKTVEARLQAVASASNIAHLDVVASLEAAKCYSELASTAKKARLNTPNLFDAIVLGTGRSLGSKIVTGDEHFKNLPETIWVGAPV